MTQKTAVALVGCGNIAAPYADSIRRQEFLELAGVTSRTLRHAEELAKKQGCKVYSSLEALLADERVEIVVNLTIHTAHAEITRKCLNAGKHIYSEKPLGITYAEARDLVELSESRGLRLGCAPANFLGEAQQTALKIIRDGGLGQVRAVYAEVNWGRIESWHPNPAPFYEVGPVFDVSVYPLTLLTAAFGPARQVTAFGRVLHPQRIQQDGSPFSIGTPEFCVALVEWENGLVARVTSSFYVTDKSKQPAGIEVHGDEASLSLSRWYPFDGTVEVAPFGGDYSPVPLVKAPHAGVEWARGLADMAAAIRENRPHRVTGAQAAHVVELINGIHRSAADSRPVKIRSQFSPPTPMEWAKTNL